MFIVMSGKTSEDVKAIRIPATSCVLFSTREEATKEAEKLAMKHKKPYTVFQMLSESNFNTNVTTEEL